MNVPNLITLSRIPILFGIAALLFIPIVGTATVAFVLFLVAAWTDWLDGHLARSQGLVSNFGKLMDALTDKVLIVGMFFTLLVFEILPLWGLFAILLILSREFLITGLRLVAASKGQVLAAERGGKWKTVFQIVSIAVLLLWSALTTDFSLSAGHGIAQAFYYAGLGVFVLATVQTVISGTQYLVKYWEVFVD